MICTVYTGYITKSDESIDFLSIGNEPPSGEEQENTPPCYKCVVLLGELQLRNLVLQTKKVEYKWFELGIALGVPIEKLERIYDKHNDSPVKALIRVYRYWLADKNGLISTWAKLVIALQKINEYSLSIIISNYVVSFCYAYIN